MADNDVTIQSSDGNEFSGTLPAYALEATQAKMLKALTQGFKLDKKQQKIAEDALKTAEQTAKGIKVNNDALRDLTDALENQMSITGLFGSVISASATVAGALLGVGTVAAGLATTVGAVAVGLGNFTAGLGTELNNMNQYGIGFQEGLIDATVRLNQLGLGVGEATQLLINNSTAVAVSGAKQIAEQSKNFAYLDSTVSRLGMSFAQGASAYAEEMEMRAELGILNQIQGRQALQSAQQVIQSQLDASKLLGKSMKEISASVQSLVQDNTNINALFNTMGQAGQDALRGLISTMSGAGIPDTIQNALGDMMGGISIADTDSAKELLTMFQMLGSEGTQAVDAIQAFRDANAVDDEEGAAAAMEQLKVAIPAAVAELRNLPKDTALAFSQANQIFAEGYRVSRRTEAALQKMRKDAADEELKGAQKFSLDFNNTMSTISGVFGATTVRIQAMLGETMGPFFEALQAADGPMEGLSNAVTDVTRDIVIAFKEVFGITGDATDLSVGFRAVGTAIREYGAQFAEWIRSFTAEPGKDTQSSLVDRLGAMLSSAITHVYDNTVKPLFLDLIGTIGTAMLDGLKGVMSELILGLMTFIGLKTVPLQVFTRTISQAVAQISGTGSTPAGGGLDTGGDVTDRNRDQRRSGGRFSKIANMAKMGGRIMGGASGIFAGAITAVDGAMEISGLNNEQDELTKKIQMLDAKIAERAELNLDTSALEARRQQLGKDMAASIDNEVSAYAGTAVGVVGAAVGGALGTLLGPAGTMLGASLGGIGGEWLGELVGGWFSETDVEQALGDPSELTEAQKAIQKEQDRLIKYAHEQRDSAAEHLAHMEETLAKQAQGTAEYNTAMQAVKLAQQELAKHEQEVMRAKAKKYELMYDLTEEQAKAMAESAQIEKDRAAKTQAALDERKAQEQEQAKLNKARAQHDAEWLKSIKLTDKLAKETLGRTVWPAQQPAVPPLRAAANNQENTEGSPEDQNSSMMTTGTPSPNPQPRTSSGGRTAEDILDELAATMTRQLSLMEEQTRKLDQVARYTKTTSDHTA